MKNEMFIVWRQISELTPAEYNPRKLSEKQFQDIKKSLEGFGQVVPIVVNQHKTRKDVIVGGHQRVKVAESMGIKEIASVYVNLPIKKEKELNIRLNKNSGEWDEEKLLEFEMIDLKEWGFSQKDLKFFDKNDDSKEEELPLKPEQTRAQLGMLYELGNHKLLCGDFNNPKYLSRLLDSSKIDLVFTDPPYNLGYEYNSYKDDKSRSEYKDFCCKWFSIINEISKKIIITTGKQNLGMWYDICNITDIGIWYASNKMSGGKISNLSLWEPIVFIGKFIRNSRPNDFFNYNCKVQADTGSHTCPKQLDLIVDIIECYSKRDNNVLDIFGGSGSTLIACEKLNRKCFMTEIDPVYCDIIIKRYCDLTSTDIEQVYLTAKIDE